VTWFKCGGFALGICNNHIIFDGLSFCTFLRNIAAMAADRAPASLPCNDRHLLSARSPPQVTFDNAELMSLRPNYTSLFGIPAPCLCYHLFRIAPDTLSDLKSKCQIDTKKKNPTGFTVVTAHLWRCKVS
jgi:Transferase family